MSIVSFPAPAEQPDTLDELVLVPDQSTLSTLTDPVERARTANEIAGHLQEAMQVVLRIRRDALREAVERGTPRPVLARHIGITASRIGQLLTGSRRGNAVDAAEVA